MVEHIPQALSPLRVALASFNHAYAVAVQQREASGLHRFVVATGDPLQPFRVTGRAPRRNERIVAVLA